MQFLQHRHSRYRISTVCQDHVRVAYESGRLQQVPDLAACNQFLQRGELWQIASCPQDVEAAQVVEVQSYAIKDPALHHVIQRWPHRSGWLGCVLPCSGRSQIMVSCVAQPATLLSILLWCQAPKHVSSNCTSCLAPSWNASSVGSSSSDDDDLLESFLGLSSLGLSWRRFHRADWTFAPGSDSGSVSSCSPKS